MTDALMEEHLARDRRLGGVDKARLLVTGPGSFSWSIAVIIAAFAWAIGLGGALSEYWRFGSDDVQPAQGVVLDTGDLNMEINERTVNWVEFEYNTDEGPYTATVFADEYYPAEGAKVSIEYLRSAPHVARITRVTRTTVAGPVAIWVFMAALLVGAFAAYRSLRALRWIQLLRSGRPARARLVEKSPTDVKINEETVYALTFEYTGEGGRSHRFTIKRHDFEDITDDPEELVLYDTSHPDRVLFMDELPFALAPGLRGRWDYVGSGSLGASIAKRLALPAIIIGIGAAF